jgi:hypothetical protein
MQASDRRKPKPLVELNVLTVPRNRTTGAGSSVTTVGAASSTAFSGTAAVIAVGALDAIASSSQSRLPGSSLRVSADAASLGVLA